MHGKTSPIQHNEKDLFKGLPNNFEATRYHSLILDRPSLPDCLEITRLNLNDNCVEGLHHKELPIFSIQCHPEASPGPHDSYHLFTYFTELMKEPAS